MRGAPERLKKDTPGSVLGVREARRQRPHRYGPQQEEARWRPPAAAACSQFQRREAAVSAKAGADVLQAAGRGHSWGRGRAADAHAEVPSGPALSAWPEAPLRHPPPRGMEAAAVDPHAWGMESPAPPSRR